MQEQNQNMVFLKNARKDKAAILLVQILVDILDAAIIINKKFSKNKLFMKFLQFYCSHCFMLKMLLLF